MPKLLSTDHEMVNFDIELIDVLDVMDAGEHVQHVHLRLHFVGGEISDKFTLPVAGLLKTSWYDMDNRVLIYQNIPNARQILTNLIRSALADIPVVVEHRLTRLGTHRIEEEALFFTGGELVRSLPLPPNAPSIVSAQQKYRIDVDPSLSEEDALAGTVAFLSLNSVPMQIILAHSLLYIMRQVYAEAWRAPCCSLYLYGRTGQFKTTIASFLTQLHNRADGIVEPIRLNSSIPAAVETLYEKSDCVIVLDDLCPRDSKKSMAQQEETLLEVVRIIGDGVIPSKMRGGKLPKRPPPSCGVLFTAEYLIGTGSDAARLLPIQFSAPIDSAELRKFQETPLIISTFYYFFIKWYIDNYFKILEKLKMWWRVYTQTDMTVHQRLRETHFFLNAAYLLFLEYCVAKGFATSESKQHLQQGFEKNLTKLVREQESRVKQEKVYKNIDSFTLICQWYLTGAFDLAKNSKKLREHDGLLKDNLLCLRSGKLLDKIRQVNPSATFADIKKDLLARDALKLDAEGKNCKIGNERFCTIYISKLR